MDVWCLSGRGGVANGRSDRLLQKEGEYREHEWLWADLRATARAFGSSMLLSLFV